MLRHCQNSYGIRGGIINRHEGDVRSSMKNAERACQDEGICILSQSHAARLVRKNARFHTVPVYFQSRRAKGKWNILLSRHCHAPGNHSNMQRYSTGSVA